MSSFNLSEWAVRHRALVLFLILVIAVAGTLSSCGSGGPRTRISR